MLVGYTRISTITQNKDRQIEALTLARCEKIYLDKVSGKDTNRPKLQEILGFIREGDTVLVTEFSRFSRSTKDLFNLVEKLQAKKVDFRSLKENVDTTTSSDKLVLTIFAALSKFEGSIIRECAAEGIAIAKAKGKKYGRREIQVDDDKLISLYNQWKDGEILQKKIMNDCKMSRTTLHKHITRLKKEGRIR